MGWFACRLRLLGWVTTALLLISLDEGGGYWPFSTSVYVRHDPRVFHMYGLIQPLIKFTLFPYLAMAGLRGRMWDLVPRLETEPGPPALGAQSLTHWTTGEILPLTF